MEPIFDRTAPKNAANPTVNRDLLRQAKELGINLSQALEDHLACLVAARRRQEWLEENREAVEAYNRRIETGGAFGDRLRRF